MKGNPKIIALLNEVLKAELTAINQYFLHAEMCENWGYERLAKLVKKESIEEMVHAEKLHRAHPLPRWHAQHERLFQDQYRLHRRTAVP